jgi:hypothetical protein
MSENLLTIDITTDAASYGHEECFVGPYSKVRGVFNEDSHILISPAHEEDSSCACELEIKGACNFQPTISRIRSDADGLKEHIRHCQAEWRRMTGVIG